MTISNNLALFLLIYVIIYQVGIVIIVRYWRKVRNYDILLYILLSLFLPIVVIAAGISNLLERLFKKKEVGDESNPE